MFYAESVLENIVNSVNRYLQITLAMEFYHSLPAPNNFIRIFLYNCVDIKGAFSSYTMQLLRCTGKNVKCNFDFTGTILGKFANVTLLLNLDLTKKADTGGVEYINSS